MSFIDDLKKKLGFGSQAEEEDNLDEHYDFENDEDVAEENEKEEDSNNELKIDLANEGEILEGDETSPESEAVSLKSKALSILMGVVALAAIVIVINNAVNDSPSIQEPQEREQTFDIPSVAQSPAGNIPDKYTDIKKLEDDKPKEVPETPVQPVVQEVPQVDPQQLQEEREYREQLGKILSSSISFGIGSGSNNNGGNNNVNSSSVYYPRMIKHQDGYVNGFSLTAGSIIPATMLSGASSDMPNTDIVAQVRQDVYDSKTGKHLLIPQGCKLVGTSAAGGERGNKRLGIIIKRIIFPNGTTYDLPSYQSVDGPGYPGLKDKYTQHSSTMMRTAAMAAIFAAAAQSMTKDTGGTDYTRSAGEEALAGAVSSVLDTAQTIVQRDANLAPTITIRPGLQFNVFINRDIVLKDYKYEPHN